MIETRLLQYFLAVAREQNITKAAESLHITQPTLSQQLRELESQLGKQLFIRGKKGITLTEEGVLFRIRATEILDLLEQTERSVRSGKNLEGGVVRIGCGETLLPDFVSNAFLRMQKIYPQVQFHVYTENTTSLTALLNKNQLDMAFLFSATKFSNYDYLPMPVRSRWGLLMPAGCKLADKASLSTEDVKSVPLIFPFKVFHTRQQPSYFPFDIRELTITAVCNHFEEAARLTTQGIGYAYILEHTFDERQYPELVFRPIAPQIITPLCLVSKKDPHLAPAPRAFLGLLREEAENLPA